MAQVDLRPDGMPNFKGNSNRAKAEEKKEREAKEKVIKGGVNMKQISPASRFMNNFFKDNITNVSKYILWDVVIPAIKNMFSETVTNGLNMMLWGDKRSVNRQNSTRTQVSYTPYSSYNQQPRSNYPYSNSSNVPTMKQVNNSLDIYNIVLDTRDDAQMVIDVLREQIDKYDSASVADLCDLIGVTSKYTDVKYGWTNFADAGVQRVSTGYMLILPPVSVIK